MDRSLDKSNKIKTKKKMNKFNIKKHKTFNKLINRFKILLLNKNNNNQ